MVRETALAVDDLILPLFVRPGTGERRPISSMPGQCQLSVDELVREAEAAHALGVPAIILFGIPSRKDAAGSEAYSPQGIICQAVRAVKKAAPNLVVITDVCLCEYTDHGHCGVVRRQEGKADAFAVDNDATLQLLAREALTHVQAGADMVAPSDMMDGRVGAIRKALDSEGHSDIPIMAYSAKYASGFYGPFREAAESPPQFGDRSTYQMDPPNSDEALREVQLDIEEGADIVMVKPAGPYLDVVREVRHAVRIPVAAYQVSGEFAMLHHAAAAGAFDLEAAVMESLAGIRRAGADILITYFAPQALGWLK
jgi:porphobilinogen synthase